MRRVDDERAGTAPLLAGRYRPLARVAGRSGAMVLQAWDEVDKRRVALDVRRSGGNADELLAEAGALLDISEHPSLPAMRGHFVEGDCHVLVLDWVDGVDLATLCRRGLGSMPVDLLLGVLAQVADALDHLHRRRAPLAHGDVTAASIVVRPDGTAALVNLGRPRRQSAGDGRTGGEPEDRPASPSEDVRDLASTAVTLLTGRPPGAGRWEWPLGAVGTALEPHLRAALSRDPAARPPSAAALATRLRGAIGATPATGPLSFMLTDIAGSTMAWEESPSAMAEALRHHDGVVATIVERHGGLLVKSRGEGDSTFTVFGDAGAAVEAAAAVRRALRSGQGPDTLRLGLRIAIHSGEVEARDGDYFGPVINRAARLRSLARPGQVLVGDRTAALLGDDLPSGCRLVDLGRRSLRDITEPFGVFELLEGDVVVDADRPSHGQATLRNPRAARRRSTGWGPASAGARTLAVGG